MDPDRFGDPKAGRLAPHPRATAFPTLSPRKREETLNSPPLARPGEGEAADQQQEAEQAREHRQYADAAYDARFT